MPEPRTTAMVTGASSGLGRSFARELARQGWTVILVGRDRTQLDLARSSLAPGPHELLVADLGQPEGCTRAAERFGRSRISLLVNCAGIGTGAPFPAAPLAAELAMLDVNVGATLRLSHAAVTAMSTAGGGAVINISSTAGTWSGGTYSAGKAWVIAFSEGLAQAAPRTGVRCLVVIPGFTRTNFQQRAGLDASAIRGWLWLDPDQVASEAMAALARGKTRYIPGRRYRVLVHATRLMPARLRQATVRRLGR